LVILIPLVLSAYTHLWNLLGFPSIHIDEAHYMRRAMLILEGMGPQESAESGYPRTYDHPYFGQLFLAGVLGVIGYPSSFNPGSDVDTIETLHLVPRILMGLLAILDTFILYRIAERRYNTTIALIASILFAIMPMTWIFRRVYLDTILVPFLLSSILFAVYIKGKDNDISLNSKSKYKISKNVLILLSGIFLGLTIYTKVPAFTMIPLVGTLVFFNSGKSLRSVGIWFIPVIILPLLWPLYSVVAGQSDLWVYWVLWQTERGSRPLSKSLTHFFQIDPLLATIGIAGIVFAAIRKDFLPLIWISPFLIFSYFIGFIQYFHLLAIFPAFCLGSAILIEYLQRIIAKYSHKLLAYTIILFVSVFGIVTTTMLITLDVNSSYYKIYAAIAEKIPDTTNGVPTKITLIGGHFWVWDSYWITQYVLDKPHQWIDPKFDPDFNQEIKTDKVLFVGDQKLVESLSRRVNSDNIRQIRELYNESKEIASFTDNVTSHTSGNYPYNTLPIMIWNEAHPTGKVLIKSNY
jgi:Dolichyl-phosphate-mannose-protein mannosyltransferase